MVLATLGLLGVARTVAFSGSEWGVLREWFLELLEEVGSVTVAADRIGVNRNTALGWARRAGVRSVSPRQAGHPGRAEYDRLRAAGVPRAGAARRVGVNVRTARVSHSFWTRMTTTRPMSVTWD
ncbi:hypothetical protein BCD48_34810 [Pseudofrankia sp. BMG5.36]|nr:hypothetical protein BCD48_34810 [Pseudofrankia sp. BMG5.36]